MEKRKVTQKDLKFGKRLQKLRKEKELTQEQLAEKTRLSTTFIGLLEVGMRKPSFKSLEKIAKALNVSVKEIIPF